MTSVQQTLFDLRKKRREVILGHQAHEAVDPKIDVPRLMTQYHRIIKLLEDYQWHTLPEIADRLGVPHGSVGSQIRNARVDGKSIVKVRTAPKSGLWKYRLLRPEEG